MSRFLISLRRRHFVMPLLSLRPPPASFQMRCRGASCMPLILPFSASFHFADGYRSIGFAADVSFRCLSLQAAAAISIDASFDYMASPFFDAAPRLLASPPPFVAFLRCSSAFCGAFLRQQPSRQFEMPSLSFQALPSRRRQLFLAGARCFDCCAPPCFFSATDCRHASSSIPTQFSAEAFLHAISV
jgi:hypothetical protein